MKAITNTLGGLQYLAITVNDVTDYNGSLAGYDSQGKVVYGAFFKPDSDSYNGIVFPWGWTADTIVYLHAMNFDGTVAAGATVKGTLYLITRGA